MRKCVILTYMACVGNAIVEKVAWTSSDESVVTVDASGVVIAHAVGTADVTATSENGLTAVCRVTVKEKLITLCLPEGVTTINEEAFCGLNAVEAIIVPDGVTTIGSAAFANCGNLLFVVLPESITSMAYDAFAGNEQLIIQNP